MATHAAIANVGDAVVRLLRASFDPVAFGDANLSLDFKVYVGDDFQQEPITQGVSLYVHRLYHSVTRRNPPGRLLPNGGRQRPMLAIDAHFMLTAWAPSADLQLELAGWMLRVMEDNPILHAGILNSRRPDVFGVDETIEVGLAQLSVEDLFRIWDVLLDKKYELSVPYVARMIPIESFIVEPAGGLVQTRATAFAVPTASSGPAAG